MLKFIKFVDVKTEEELESNIEEIVKDLPIITDFKPYEEKPGWYCLPFKDYAELEYYHAVYEGKLVKQAEVTLHKNFELEVYDLIDIEANTKRVEQKLKKYTVN